MSSSAALDRQQVQRDAIDVSAERRFWTHEAGGEFAHRCYEGDGLRYWQRFTATAKNYYPLRSEVALIDAHADELAALVRQNLSADEDLTLIELGLGSKASLNAKTAKIVEAVQPARFVGIDYSGDVLQTAKGFLSRRFRQLPVATLQADFNKDRMSLPGADRRLMVQFGTTISNVPGRRDAPLPVHVLSQSLANYRRHLRPGDFLAIGYDSNQDGQSATDAYRHPDHAAFSENLLTVMARHPAIEGLRAQDFAYEPQWQDHAKLVTHDLVAHRSGQFRLAAEPMYYTAGERFNYSNSYKYPVSVFDKAAAVNGLHPWTKFMDGQQRVGIHVLKAV